MFVIFEECKAKRTSQWQKNCKTEEIYGVAPVVNYQDPRVDKRKPLSPKRQLKPNPRVGKLPEGWDVYRRGGTFSVVGWDVYPIRNGGFVGFCGGSGGEDDDDDDYLSKYRVKEPEEPVYKTEEELLAEKYSKYKGLTSLVVPSNNSNSPKKDKSSERGAASDYEIYGEVHEKLTYATTHEFNIHSLGMNSDGETFLSCDDLRINLWNVERATPCFNIVDLKSTADLSQLDEVITAMHLHPGHCDLVVYGTSKGNLHLVDTRQNAKCSHALVFGGITDSLDFALASSSSASSSSPFSASSSSSIAPRIRTLVAGVDPVVEETEGGGGGGGRGRSSSMKGEENKLLRELVSSISDVKWLGSGTDDRLLLTRDYFSMKVWDLKMASRTNAARGTKGFDPSNIVGSPSFKQRSSTSASSKNTNNNLNNGTTNASGGNGEGSGGGGPVEVIPMNEQLMDDINFLFDKDLLFDPFRCSASSSGNLLVSGSYDSLLVLYDRFLKRKSYISLNHAIEMGDSWSVPKRNAAGGVAKKVLNVAYHPVHDLVAVASGSYLYFYGATNVK
ncbi:protein phosphatase 2A regulatory subunit cdc55 [Balamuthia mandrillaris]